MINFDVSLDIKNAMKALNEVQRAVIPQAASAALNRVATSARRVAVDTIRKETNIKAGAVRKYVTVSKSNKSTLTATIRASKYAPNLINFGARETKKGVSANAWSKRKIYRGAFIGNKGRTVFIRQDYKAPAGKRGRRAGANRTISQHTRKAHTRRVGGKSVAVQSHPVGRGPKRPKSKLKALYGPSVRREFIRDVAQTAMMTTIRERWPVEFQREAQFRIDKAMAGR
jgi:hypothetical protein